MDVCSNKNFRILAIEGERTVFKFFFSRLLEVFFLC